MPPNWWPGRRRSRLARIDLIHPDPWPKRRHWKRRFVQDATVAAMARVLKPDGEFRFVCDIDDYVAWTLAHLLRSPDFVWLAERADDWRLPWPDYTMTRYGTKAEREGRRAAYLRFRKDLILRSRRVRRCVAKDGAGLQMVRDARERCRCLTMRELGACTHDLRFAASPAPFRASVASHTMRLPRSRPKSSIGS